MSLGRYCKIDIILIIVLLCDCLSTAYGREFFGRYIGSLTHDGRGIQQLAKVDFITSRDNQNSLKIMAVLTVFFGGFDSEEYISYHFDDVTYNLVTAHLIMSQSDQQITVKSTEIGDGTISAMVRSASTGIVGTLSLTKEDTLSISSSELIRKVSGEYIGTCSGRESFINLQTYRSTSDTVRIGNPFGAYKIKGQIGGVVPKLCRSKKPCVTNQILEGSYNFYTGSLILFGSKKTERCQFDRDQILTCGSCKYKKRSKNRKLTQSQTIWSQKNIFELQDLHKNGLYLKEGEYKGYLFHERRNIFQRASIDIVNFQRAKQNQYVISSVANLYFGSFDTNELLSYRFDDQPFNILNTSLVLERSQSDIDAVLHITNATQDHVSGVWYSILFGRVGTFYFLKEGLPDLPNHETVINSLSGEYVSKNRILNLEIFLGQTPINTENPFFPLTISGYFSYQARVTSRVMISGGSFDFYTGYLGIESVDSKRISSGEILNNSGDLSLHWQSAGFGTVTQGYEEKLFAKIL